MNRLTPLLALFCTAALVYGCPSSPTEPADHEGSAEAAPAEEAGAEANEEAAAEEEPTELVVYSGRGEALVGPLFEQFEAESGISLRVNYAGTSQLAATLLEEGDNTPADVFFAQDVNTLGLLEQQGAFATLPDEVQARVSPAFRSAAGAWVGTSGRARVVTYNSDKVQPEQLPSRLTGFTEPAWRGRVGWAPENSSFQAFLAAMIELEGDDAARAFVQGMLANEARAYPSNTPGVTAVGAGEIDAMITNHYYLYRIREEHGADYPVENHYLQNGHADSLVMAAGVGVVTHSDQQEAAAQLVAFLLSEEAEKHFVVTNREFPTVPGVAGPDGLPTIGELNSPQVEATRIASLERAVQLLQETGAL